MLCSLPLNLIYKETETQLQLSLSFYSIITTICEAVYVGCKLIETQISIVKREG